MRACLSTLRFWVPPLIWMVVIFSASGDGASAHRSSILFEPLMRWLFPWMSEGAIGEIHYLFRKCAHLAEFAVLAGLFWQAIWRSRGGAAGRWSWREAGIALALVVVYAASDELHQTFVPGRTGQVSDVLVDAFGGTLGLGALWVFGRVGRRW